MCVCSCTYKTKQTPWTDDRRLELGMVTFERLGRISVLKVACLLKHLDSNLHIEKKNLCFKFVKQDWSSSFWLALIFSITDAKICF